LEDDVRVIAGEFKGRRLKAPEGMGTRPTIDRVKESVISSIYSARGGLDDAVVLDAFAGSGGLGIECLSRGAKTALFYEYDRKAQRALRENIDMLKLQAGRARIVQSDVLKRPPTVVAMPFDVVLLDPPYAYDLQVIVDFLRTLRDAKALADGAIVSYEHDSSCALAPVLERSGLDMDILTTKRFGGTTIDICRIACPDEEE
jgi:16S rRNA (guanine966-N2)-methyltransferase